jgi:hypothetical protein
MEEIMEAEGTNRMPDLSGLLFKRLGERNCPVKDKGVR